MRTQRWCEFVSGDSPLNYDLSLQIPSGKLWLFVVQWEKRKEGDVYAAAGIFGSDENTAWPGV